MPLAEACQIMLAESEPARLHGGAVARETNERASGDALARAGFADKGDRLARRDGERDVVHHTAAGFTATEGDGEILDDKRRSLGAGCHQSRPSIRRCR